MPIHDGDLPPEDIQERMDDGEPLIGTPLLDFSLRLSLPFRGERRKVIIATIRDNVRSRRQADVLVNRVSDDVVSPFKGAVQEETKDMIRSRMSSMIGRGE
jgi:hypothetical protein